MSDTPITDKAVREMEIHDETTKWVDPEEMADLERAANAMEEALSNALSASYDGPLPDYARKPATEALAQYRKLKP